MPGRRFGRRAPSKYAGEWMSNWRYVCKRCNVEGYGLKAEPCWMCGKDDKMDEALAIVEKSNGASWNNPHVQEFREDTPDATEV